MQTVLTLWRRHLKKCPHGKKGRRWTKCQCPVWVSGLFKGFPIKQSLKTTSWTRAQQILTLWELGQFGKAETAEVTVEIAIARFLEDAAAREIRPSSVKKQRQVLNRLAAWSQEQGLVLLRQINVQAMRDFRSTWQLAAVTSNKMLERLRSFFRFCVDNEWLEKNPAAPLKRAKENQEPTLPFTKEEILRILQALEEHRQGKTGLPRDNAERLRALVLVMRWTGLRISDAVMLHKGQVDDGGIIVRQAKTRVPVRIPVPPEVTAALALISESRGGRPQDDVFYYFAPGPGDHQTRAGNWRRRLRWLFEKANIPNGHAHRFRDTLAVELLLAGVPIERVSMLLGHESVKTTQKHYSPWVAARQAQLEDDVRRLWDPNSNKPPQERGETSESVSHRKKEAEGMVSRAGLGETIVTNNQQLTEKSKRPRRWRR